MPLVRSSWSPVGAMRLPRFLHRTVVVGSHGCVIPWPRISEVWNSHTDGAVITWTCEESIVDSCSQKTPDTENGASFLSTLQMLVARSNLLQDVDDIIPAILPMAFIVPASPNSMRTAAAFFEASTQDTKFRVLDVGSQR